MKILDTDHCVAILRKRLDPQVLLRQTDAVAISSISMAELVHGAHRSARVSENLSRIDDLAGIIEVLPFDEACARIFGAIKHELQQRSSVIEDLDIQIASVALRHTAILVSHNQKHYQRVQGLALEDWL